MPTQTQLKRVAIHFDRLTSDHTAVAARGDIWSRIAAATEEMAGITTGANLTPTGNRLRTVIALESMAGTDGSEENPTTDGYLKRMVDALKVLTADTRLETGEIGRRFAALALQLELAAPPSPDGWAFDFSDATVSGLLALLLEEI